MLKGGKVEGEKAAQLTRTYCYCWKFGEVNVETEKRGGGGWLCLTDSCSKIGLETICKGVEGCVSQPRTLFSSVTRSSFFFISLLYPNIS